jgi:hypothetical protein
LTVLSPGARRTPPAPKGSSAEFRIEWRRAWSAPISDIWDTSDHPLVERLVALRTRIRVDRDKAPMGVHAAVGVLEQQLGLTPRTRKAMGYVIGEPQADLAPVEAFDKRRRARIAKGL